MKNRITTTLPTSTRTIYHTDESSKLVFELCNNAELHRIHLETHIRTNSRHSYLYRVTSGTGIKASKILATAIVMSLDLERGYGELSRYEFLSLFPAMYKPLVDAMLPKTMPFKWDESNSKVLKRLTSSILEKYKWVEIKIIVEQ